MDRVNVLHTIIHYLTTGIEFHTNSIYLNVKNKKSVIVLVVLIVHNIWDIAFCIS